MQPTIKTRTVYDGSVKAAKAFGDLRKMHVYVGIPEAKDRRAKGQEIGNAALAFILTHGVRNIDARRRVGAAMINRRIDFEAATRLYMRSHGNMAFNIPPRPIIEPALEAADNRQAITRELGAAAKATLDGATQTAITFLKRAGMEAQNRVRAWFTDPRNNWAPNAPSTVRRKGSANPNIDKGELRKSIVYVLSEES